MNLREFFDADSPRDAAWCFVLAVLAFAMWPLVLLVVIAAMVVPWGSLGRRRVAEISVKLALTTAAWCGFALVGVWIARGL